MNYIHQNLAAGRWRTFSLAEQLAHIGSEVGRSLDEGGDRAKIRALELIDLTLADTRWRGRYREFTRLREVFCDLSFGENVYHSTTASFDEYFFPFMLLSRRGR